MKGKQKDSKKSLNISRIVPVLFAFMLILSAFTPYVAYTAVTTVAASTTVFDDFEDGDISDWNNVDNRDLESTTVFEGSYSIHVNPACGCYTDKTITQISQPNNISYAWNLAYLGSSDTYDPRVIFKDNDGHTLASIVSTTDGELAYRASSVVSTGFQLQTDKWYVIRIENIDYSMQTYDIAVHNAAGEEIFTYSGAEFYDTSNTIDGLATVMISDTGDSSLGTYVDNIKANSEKPTGTSPVSGVVSDGSGNPVADANVVIEDSGNNVVFDGLTNSNGEYSTDLADGDYTVTASKEKYHSDSSTFTVSGSSVTQNLTIETQEIRGTIQDSDGNLISGSDIIVKDKSNGNIVLNETNASTTYEVTVSDGDYWVNVSHPDYMSNETSVSLTSDENTDEYHDVILRMENEVTGEVTNSNGEPLANATVKVYNDNISKEATTDADGVYSFYLKSADYTINVTKTTYKPYESQISINSSTQLNTIELEAKEYNLNLRVSPYMNHSDSQKYVIRFNDEVITEQASISSSNTSLISINTTTQTLNATNIMNDTGKVNITATYRIDGKTVTDSQNVTVAPMTIEHVEILSPLYGTLALVSDETIQYLILVIIAGVGVTTMVNAFGGISLMIMSLIIGWIIDYIPEGVLLASLFGGIFIMMNTQLREYRTK